MQCVAELTGGCGRQTWLGKRGCSLFLGSFGTISYPFSFQDQLESPGVLRFLAGLSPILWGDKRGCSSQESLENSELTKIKQMSFLGLVRTFSMLMTL